MFAVKLDNFLRSMIIWKDDKYKERKKEALHMLTSWKESKTKFKILWKKTSDATTYWNKLKTFLRKEKKHKIKDKLPEGKQSKELHIIE
jgi:hypothetical protein